MNFLYMLQFSAWRFIKIVHKCHKMYRQYLHYCTSVLYFFICNYCGNVSNIAYPMVSLDGLYIFLPIRISIWYSNSVVVEMRNLVINKQLWKQVIELNKSAGYGQRSLYSMLTLFIL